MASNDNPFDPTVRLHRGGCACGRHANQSEHDQTAALEAEALQSRAVENAVMRALFPQDNLRRAFLRQVGAGTALAAISTFFPLAAAKEAFAATTGTLEKTKLKVGFIPITCARRSSWRTHSAFTPNTASTSK